MHERIENYSEILIRLSRLLNQLSSFDWSQFIPVLGYIIVYLKYVELSLLEGCLPPFFDNRSRAIVDYSDRSHSGLVPPRIF
jgi:hypothetical protein